MLYRLQTRPLIHLIKELFSLKAEGKIALVFFSHLADEVKTPQMQAVCAEMLEPKTGVSRLFLTPQNDFIIISIDFDEKQFQTALAQCEQVISCKLSYKIFPLNQGGYQEILPFIGQDLPAGDIADLLGQLGAFKQTEDYSFFTFSPVLHLSSTVHQQAFTLCQINRRVFEKEYGSIPDWIWLEFKKKLDVPECDAFTGCELTDQSKTDNPFVLLNLPDYLTCLHQLKKIINDLKKQEKKVLLANISADLYWVLNFNEINPDMIGICWDVSKSHVIQAILKKQPSVVLQQIETQNDLSRALSVGGQFFAGTFINKFIAIARHQKCPSHNSCSPELCERAFADEKVVCLCPEHLKNWLFTLPREKQ